MTTVYYNSPPRYPFVKNTHSTTHYTSDVTSHMHNMQLHYNAYMVDGHHVPSAPIPRSPPSSTNGINQPTYRRSMSPTYQPNMKYTNYHHTSPVKHSPPYRSNNMIQNSMMYMNNNSVMSKSYQDSHVSTFQAGDILYVSPGLPTPIELSIYENKQPTGVLHVTKGNQTVEFLDGVANLPPSHA